MTDQELNLQEVREDLTEFLGIIRDRFAYADANGYDYQNAVQELLPHVDHGLPANELGLALYELLANFIDGHIQVNPYLLADGFLPFRLELADDRIVAVKTDRSGLLAERCPYLAAIDGVDIDVWLAAAQQIVPIGTEHYVRWRSVRHLCEVQHWRRVLNAIPSASITVDLYADDSREVVASKHEVASSPHPKSVWPESGSRILDGNVGYLRLHKMDEAAIHEVDTWMPRFRDTEALIVDVRDNTGGLRTPLLRLFPYFMQPEEEAVIGSVAAYRRWGGFTDNHLAARHMVRENTPGLTDRELEAIAEFKNSFVPERDLRDEGFSDWHYLVLTSDGETCYYYDRRVLVLMNEKCFSATDIFLGAMKTRSNVTLIGVPSSGGSGYGIHYTLPNSKIKVRLASMISFQPDGRLYDTRGITPHVLHTPVPSDFVRGGTDSMLDAALNAV